MSDCPCCSNTLLRQLRSHQVVWFCRHCWQEMPNVSAMTNVSAVTKTMPRHSRQASQLTRQAITPTLVPQFATLSSIQHHPLAAAYLTPSMPGMLVVPAVPAPSPAVPVPVFAGLSLVPDINRPALATA
jgi:hypothetical protein